MEVVNDNSCGWINDLNPRTDIKSLQSDENCDWIIIGAGYTGLSAARKLAQLHPNQKIIIVDAQLAGEGASSRNSGYLVDTTLNDGFTSNKEIENYKKKTDIYKLGIKTVKKFIPEAEIKFSQTSNYTPLIDDQDDSRIRKEINFHPRSFAEGVECLIKEARENQ